MTRYAPSPKVEQHGHLWRVNPYLRRASCDCHGFIGFVLSREGDPIKIGMLWCKEKECGLPASSISLGRGGRCVLHGG